MTKTFVIADTHFGHVGVCKFMNSDGSKMRPWNNYEDMDKDMIEMWNDIVSPNDNVYHLGDVVINRRALPTLSKLNGKKVLIKGNHDIFRIGEYLEYFYDVRAYHVLKGVIMSHIPLHPSALKRFGCNVHGHLHSNRVLLDEDENLCGKIDPRYYCVSVEHLNFKPILFEEMVENIVKQGGQVEFKS